MAPEETAGLKGSSLNGSHEPKHTEAERTGDIDGTRDHVDYIQGSRFWLICTAMVIMMFMTNFEVPVVITALVAISSELGGFGNVGWVIASYLLGYVAVIVIFAKFSDIFGRKPILLLSIAVFIVFSAACSASQTLLQLIVFRAFQGIGGGGCFSLCTIMVTDLVPPEKYTQFVSNISVTNAIALLLGPIVGGAIAAHTTWRWIFIINVPISAPAFLIAILAIPKDFPHHIRANGERENRLTAAFEGANKEFPWRSAFVITLVAVSGVLWILLVLWERHVTIANQVREPILPWRFLVSREMMGILLNFVLLGGPTVIGMFIIPQRFELVYGASGLDAGVRLIPFTFFMAVGSILASIMATKMKIPAIYVVIAGSCLQVLGFALIGTLPSTLYIPPKIYGFEIIAGLGCGMNYALLFVLVPFVVEERDRAVGLGVASQFRFVGSSMLLAISTSIFNGYVRSRLEALLEISNSDLLSTFLFTLPQELQEQARYILAEGYNRQILALCVSAALQVPASLLMWKKKQVVV
ncbi:hypothetical protein JX265_008711 [Neoarthrinium moseri]|uniref:Major facilitator superfamily (MFS) profile domain-containing protein n=1 Tax=Neoarthrinium moseri TaxID=1658444 RepID=A0A9Q0AN89_9PEZI|nr:hypothetical protein JX265_008711 [Neoarthrinium moseri]